MKPARIDHANVFDGYKDVVVEMDLTDEDKEAIHKYHKEKYSEDYNVSDVSMLVYVKFESEKATDILYVAYYPEQIGETEYPFEHMNKDTVNECMKFVTENYFGNEEKYENV